MKLWPDECRGSLRHDERRQSGAPVTKLSVSLNQPTSIHAGLQHTRQDRYKLSPRVLSGTC